MLRPGPDAAADRGDPSTRARAVPSSAYGRGPQIERTCQFFVKRLRCGKCGSGSVIASRQPKRKNPAARIWAQSCNPRDDQNQGKQERKLHSGWLRI